MVYFSSRFEHTVYHVWESLKITQGETSTLLPHHIQINKRMNNYIIIINKICNHHIYSELVLSSKNFCKNNIQKYEHLNVLYLYLIRTFLWSIFSEKKFSVKRHRKKYSIDFLHIVKIFIACYFQIIFLFIVHKHFYLSLLMKKQ